MVPAKSFSSVSRLSEDAFKPCWPGFSADRGSVAPRLSSVDATALRSGTCGVFDGESSEPSATPKSPSGDSSASSATAIDSEFARSITPSSTSSMLDCAGLKAIDALRGAGKVCLSLVSDSVISVSFNDCSTSGPFSDSISGSPIDVCSCLKGRLDTASAGIPGDDKSTDSAPCAAEDEVASTDA